MALTETEELELLELEEQEATAQKSSSTGGYKTTLQKYADISQKIQQQLLGPVAKAGDYVARKYSKFQFGSEKPVDYIQKGIGLATGALERGGEVIAEQGGKLGFPKTGATLGMIASEAPYFALPMGKTSKLGLEGVTTAGARRSLGMGKGIMKKLYGGVERANLVGNEMLDRGVITPFASSEKMLGRADVISKRAGDIVQKTIKQIANKRSVDATDVGVKVLDRLKRETSGLSEGAFKADNVVMNEIGDTIMSAGPGPISFEKGQVIKQKLQEMGKFERGMTAEESTKASLYRKASGIFRKEYDAAIRQQGKKISEPYLVAKKEFGLAEDAKKGLNDQYLAELGNKAPTLRGSIVAAGGLGSGKLGWAGAALLLQELLARKGSQLSAYTAGKALPSTIGNPLFRQALTAGGAEPFMTAVAELRRSRKREE